MLSQNCGFDEKQVVQFIMKRFQPRQSDEIITEEVKIMIQQSGNSFSPTIQDFFHKHSQEKTVQNGVSQVIQLLYEFYNKSYNIVTGLSNSD